MPTNFDALSKTELEAIVSDELTSPEILAKAQAELDWIGELETWAEGIIPETGRTLGQLIGMFALGPRRGFIIPPPPPVH